MTIYVDILGAVKCWGLEFQQDIHNPVKAVRQIQEFTWSMAKLKLFMDNAIENHTIRMQLNKSLNSVENINSTYFYKGIKLTRFDVSKDEISDIFAKTIASITNCMEKKFHELVSPSTVKNLVSLLDISTWPIDLPNFGLQEISEI